MKKFEFFKSPDISAALLRSPQVIDQHITKGVLILTKADHLLNIFPILKKIYFIVERHGWHGVNESRLADVKLVEDLSTWEYSKKEFSSSILLDIGPADFVDHSYFFPSNINPQYDVIQISCWSRRKRIEMLIDAASKLPHISFVHLGHFENNDIEDELLYKRECLKRAEKIAPNIHFPFSEVNDNSGLPTAKSEINFWINKARIGLLTATNEGINRFKMECFSADRPCLLPNDLSNTTLKHVTSQTGMLFEPNASALACAIEELLATRIKFSPRDYVLEKTGKERSLKKMRDALQAALFKEGGEGDFIDIDWDGRNESQLWGDDAYNLLVKLSFDGERILEKL